MLCPTPFLVAAMIFTATAFSILGFFILNPVYVTTETPCPDGRFCPSHWLCCEHGCCAPATAPPRRDIGEALKEHGFVYPWYAQWPVLFLLGILGGILVCCVWCLFFKGSRHGIYFYNFSCCTRRPTSEHDSAGSIYPPPRYSRCNSFHQAPPPYAEVTSKPDLYPLVITCGEGEGKSGSYLMVHYFRNYVLRTPGSLSATSAGESLNSSYTCNADNEANSIIPPPYSCANNCLEGYGMRRAGSLLRSLSSLTEPRETRIPPPPRSKTAPEQPPFSRPRESSAVFRENLISSPVQPLERSLDLELELMDCELYCDGGCKPRLGSSPPPNRSPSNIEEIYDPEVYGLRQLFTCPSPDNRPCESPPQPTSPTQSSKDSTLRRSSEDRRHRRFDSIRKSIKTRKSSLYMPLTVAYPTRSRVSPGSRISSRSAPATPCGALVPNILNLTQKVSASKHSFRSPHLQEERNPLLDNRNETESNHKF